MVRRFSIHPSAARAGALIVVVLIAAMTALSLHRNGHTQGDDFALYLRQARSLFDGDIDQVVADNRFAVLNSNNGFSPNAYPWGWPLLLSPFVHLWGLDYDRLKLIEVGLLCAWLVLLHGIIRRRVGRPIALAVIAVLGTAPAFLGHTDQLLSEFPHLVAVAVVIWWYDRMRARGPLVGASTPDLAILGALSTLAFNMRREGIVLVGVIAVIQAIELFGGARSARGSRVRTLIRSIQTSWRNVLVPHVAFAVSTTLFQLLLPTALLPDNGNSREFINNRFGDYPGVLTGQLGIGRHPAIGVAIVAVALIGVVIGVRRRPSMDGVLALLAALTALTISTHFRLVDRYWFQVTPWVLYFAAVAVAAAVGFCVRHHPRVSTSIALGAVAVVDRRAPRRRTGRHGRRSRLQRLGTRAGSARRTPTSSPSTTR